jgi:tRNA(Ile)-lysidine synthase
MIKVQYQLPKLLGVAVSGGVDSMAALDFLRRKHTVVALHFNHGQSHADSAEKVVRDYCTKHGLLLCVRKIDDDKIEGSVEDHFRKKRYEFLDEYSSSAAHGAFEDLPIVTAHQLDDCVESWIFNSIRRGYTDVIPYRRNNVIRPFRLNRKSVFQEWAFEKNVPFFEDPTNNETKYDRNFIRHEMMSQVLRINPGIHTMVMKKMLYEDIK